MNNEMNERTGQSMSWTQNPQVQKNKNGPQQFMVDANGVRVEGSNEYLSAPIVEDQDDGAVATPNPPSTSEIYSESTTRQMWRPPVKRGSLLAQRRESGGAAYGLHL